MNRIMKTSISVFLLILGINFSCFSQKIVVKGKVTGLKDQALPGVTVSSSESEEDVITNENGSYSIIANIGDTLLFERTAFLGKEVKVTKSKLNVYLDFDMDFISFVQMDESLLNDLNNQINRLRIENNELHKRPMMIPPAIMSAAEYPAQITDNSSSSSREQYPGFTENRFISPYEEALSTFSIDTDAASYTNFRRFINNGTKVLGDAIRTEEFINYFDYNYAKPTKAEPIKLTTETATCPWAEQHRLVRIGLKAGDIDAKDLPASNFVFLIDVSGSMSGPNRMGLVKSSMNLLINNLRDNDRVAIVVYSGKAGEVLPSTSGSNKQAIRNALNKLSAGGSTAGGAGIQLAYKIARQNFIEGGNNRIILCTDGDFNVGVSDNEGLEKLIEEERNSGVFLSVLGYGMGNYKDDKMQILAQKGNGNAAYIDNLQEANRVLVSEFGGTLFTIAKDVKLQVEFNPAKVQAYRLIGYETRLLNKEDFNNDSIDAGEIGVGQKVTALYEIIPTGIKSDFILPADIDELKYQKKNKAKLTNSPELLTVKLRYKDPEKDISKKISHPVIDRLGSKASPDMRFASAVAMLTQLLKNSDFKGNSTYDKVISLAKSAVDNDPEGYKHEFVRLAIIAKNMAEAEE